MMQRLLIPVLPVTVRHLIKAALQLDEGEVETYHIIMQLLSLIRM